MELLHKHWKDVLLVALILFLLTDEGYIESRLHDELTHMTDFK